MHQPNNNTTANTMTSFTGFQIETVGIAASSILRTFFLVCIACILPTWTTSADPTNRYVAKTGGSSTAPYDTWAKASSDLKTVVDYANTFNERDVVIVSNGTYTLSATVAVNNTVVRSVTSNVADVVVNGNGTVRCFSLTHTNSLLVGLTISNGYVGAAFTCGGGIECTVMGATISNCSIGYNQAAFRGGGIYLGTVLNCTIVGNTGWQGGGLYGCHIANSIIVGNRSGGEGGGLCAGDAQTPVYTISNCIIAYNTCGPSYQIPASGGGGGISCYNNVANIVNCTIRDNVSSAYGGGVRSGSASSVSLRNCLIARNSATNGGGVYNGGGGVYLLNCTVASNKAELNYGGWYGGAIYATNTINYFNIAAGTSSNWGGTAPFCWNSCTAPTNGLGAGSANNISKDPLFTDLGDGYFHLMRGSSPCINMGTNEYAWMNIAVDLDGRPRIQDGVVDMGAYESFPKGTIFRGY